MKHRKVRWVVFAIVLVLLAAGVYAGYRYAVNTYTVKTVYVEGNVHYTEEEIKAIVLDGILSNNTLYLKYKYKNALKTDIPFVETVSVKIESADTIRISVYEKTLAGYIEYLGGYVYFDKDGIVVEVSSEKTAGIPEVLGLNFDYVILHEALPVEDDSLFDSILNITKLMTKYDVNAQKVYFKPGSEIVLYSDDITINLGTEENIDIKIMNLKGILNELQGMKGTLRMEKYDEGTKKITFEPFKD